MDWIRSEWSARGLPLEAGPGPSGPVTAPVPSPAEAEFAASQTGALLVPLPDAQRLRLGGADRVDFLHGQVSNDVRGLRPGATNRSLLLNHKGQALAEMSVLRRGDHIDVVVEGGAVAVVEESLRRHIIFDQVELGGPEAPEAVLTLQGREAEAMLARAIGAEGPAEGSFLDHYFKGDFEGAPVTVWRSKRSSAGGFDLLTPGAMAEKVVLALLSAGATAGGRPALELARVSAGIASVAGEAGAGVLPQEAGLDALVSYRKGCYLGQEIMARIEARGNLRRRLGMLLLESQPAEAESVVRSDGRTVGRLGTVVRHPALGLVALAVLRSDLSEDSSLEVGGAAARPAPTPLTDTSAG
jgi:folate-binding protein YgfZ